MSLRIILAAFVFICNHLRFAHGQSPTMNPTVLPTKSPSDPTPGPSFSPTTGPTGSPTGSPTQSIGNGKEARVSMSIAIVSNLGILNTAGDTRDLCNTNSGKINSNYRESFSAVYATACGYGTEYSEGTVGVRMDSCQYIVARSGDNGEFALEIDYILASEEDASIIPTVSRSVNDGTFYAWYDEEVANIFSDLSSNSTLSSYNADESGIYNAPSDGGNKRKFTVNFLIIGVGLVGFGIFSLVWVKQKDLEEDADEADYHDVGNESTQQDSVDDYGGGSSQKNNGSGRTNDSGGVTEMAPYRDNGNGGGDGDGGRSTNETGKSTQEYGDADRPKISNAKRDSNLNVKQLPLESEDERNSD